jgi:hypothetical protein
MATILNRTTTFATNGTVTAAGLHNLIDDTSIYAGLITTQTELTTVGTADQILIAVGGVSDTGAPRRATVQNLFEDTLTSGTFVNLSLTGALTYGTATGNRTVSTSATITTGTIPNLTAGTTTSTAATITNGTITTALIPTLTAGTTTGTAGIFTSGTIGNLSTTLAGDFTISQGTGTLGTTGATSATYGTTNAIPRITVDAKGRVTAASEVTAPVGFRNRIINGDIGIWQRGTSFTASTYSYSADRWSFGNFVNTTVSQSTSVPTGFKYSLKVQRPAAATSVTSVIALQTIESVNCLDMAGQSVTLSFYAKAGANYSSASNSLSVQLITGTVADQGGSSYDTWTGSAQSIGTTVTLTTSFQRFTVTGTVASNALEMAPVFFFNPTGTAGADDSFHITGVQLEAGSTATDFERRPIGTELALCQRYFAAFPGPSAGQFGPSGSLYNTTAGAVFYRFAVPMRASPTLSGTASASAFEIIGIGPVNGTISSTSMNTQGVKFDGTSLSSAGSVGQPLVYISSGLLSAEL